MNQDQQTIINDCNRYRVLNQEAIRFFLEAGLIDNKSAICLYLRSNIHMGFDRHELPTIADMFGLGETKRFIADFNSLLSAKIIHQNDDTREWHFGDPETCLFCLGQVSDNP